MIKYLFMLAAFCFVLSSELNAQVTIEKIDSASLEFIRQTFYASVEDEDELDKLENFLKNNYGTNFNNIDPIITAYYGAVEALKGKHAFFPFTKLNYVISSQKILVKAIEMEPESIEIRFIRFSILHHLPGILGYGKERDEDLAKLYYLLLKKDYSEVSMEIQKGIVEFMLDSERLTDLQTTQLQKLAASFAVK